MSSPDERTAFGIEPHIEHETTRILTEGEQYALVNEYIDLYHTLLATQGKINQIKRQVTNEVYCRMLGELE
jgi:hypothetical protein